MMTNQTNGLTTVVSYPERGEGGNHKYRGNCSPRLIAGLIGHFQPREVCDYMCGSNSTGDAARSMGISGHTYDLHSGVTATTPASSTSPASPPGTPSSRP